MAAPITADDILALLIREGITPRVGFNGYVDGNGVPQQSAQAPLLQPIINSVIEIIKNDGYFKQKLTEAVMAHVGKIAEGVAENLAKSVLDVRTSKPDSWDRANVSTRTTTVAKWAEDLVSTVLADVMTPAVRTAAHQRLHSIDLDAVEINVSATVAPKVTKVVDS